jgi:hypothetical protein
MGESAKALLALGLIAFAIAAAVSWVEISASPAVVWALRLGFPLAAFACLATLLWAHFRKDRAPDFLKQHVGQYFERDGFCFHVACTTEGSIALLTLYFQNRYERPCDARVVVQPSRGFWMNRPIGGVVAVDFCCDGGAFGVTRVPWGIPHEYQGKTGSFDVAAAVRYREGRGGMLRFRDGLAVGKTSLDGWQVTLTVAGLLAGKVVMNKPAKFKLSFPAAVSTEARPEWPVTTETLWRPGDGQPREVAIGDVVWSKSMAKGGFS